MPSFSQLSLSPALLDAVGALGFDTPTPIQAEAIPAALRGADLVASAQTGSGKTVAYALPLLQRLQHAGQAHAGSRRRVDALVLVPTRELAAQAGDVIRQLASHLPSRPGVAVVFGGVSINPQMMGLRGGADVMVATPGRLLDLAAHNAVDLGAVRMLVLDEADRLLDLGFAEELDRVLALVPAERQTLLFSATFPPAVRSLADALLRTPVRIDIADTEVNQPDIVQRAIAVDAVRRTELLRHLLQSGSWDRALVFVATRHAAEHVAWKLYSRGLFATPFHGEMSQGARQRVLDEFKNGQWDVLVTTDLAARGIDIEQLSLVVNYDLPRSPVDYVHRIGRTGRAGQSGVAISLVTPEAEAHFRLIEKRQQVRVPREQVPGFEPQAGMQEDAETGTAQAAADGTGGIKGRRPSKKDKLRAAAALAAAAAMAADKN